MPDRNSAAVFLPRYFAALDGPDPVSALELISPDLRFAILFSTDSSSENQQIAGGPFELRSYLEARGPCQWRHHLTVAARDKNIELAHGETIFHDGTVAATFVCAVQLDGNELMRRFIAGRTPAIGFP